MKPRVRYSYPQSAGTGFNISTHGSEIIHERSHTNANTPAFTQYNTGI